MTSKTPSDVLGETWRFSAECPRAERVYLVKQTAGASGVWVLMEPRGEGQFEVLLELAPGDYRFHYVTAEGETFLNHGQHGLVGTRLSKRSGSVRVDHGQVAQSA